MKPEPPPLEWKLHTVMSDRGIRTATELARRLQRNQGITLTPHQISRVVRKLPQRLNTELFLALILELDCKPSDLLRFSGQQQPPQ